MSDHADNLKAFSIEIVNAARVATGALVSRAADAHGVDAMVMLPRVERIVVKHLLHHKPYAPASEVTEFIATLHADDLCLAIACERGSETAWRELVARFTPSVKAAARAAARNETDADDLAQSVWAELHGLRARRDSNNLDSENSDNRTRGKLAYYSGCGSLGGYLRAVVAQLAVDLHRRTRRFIQPDEQTDFDHYAHDGTTKSDDMPHAFRHQHIATLDPEAALAQREQAGVLRETFARAVAALAPEDGLLVKLYYLDQLRLKEAGVILGIHEATASRRLARVHATLRHTTEEILHHEYHWTPHDIASAFEALTQATNFDLRTFLGASNNHDEIAGDAATIENMKAPN